MNVLPSLLLLMQLAVVQLVRTDQALHLTSESSVVTNNNNGTALDTGANMTAGPLAVTVKPPEAYKPVKVITEEASSPVLVRGVIKTDTVTMQVNGTLSLTTQAPQVIKLTTSTTVTTKLANTTTSKPDKLVADGVSLSDVNSNKSNIGGSHSSNTNTTIADSNGSHGKTVNSSISNNSSAASNTSSSASTYTKTSTTTSTTIPTTISTITITTRPTTTTTTTARPKKPTVTSSMEKLLEGEKLDMIAPNSDSVAPHVLPVQEMNNLADRAGNEYILPIVTIMLALPLAIAFFISVYRRFRNLWSTRHYRRMDFLVDGMYND